MRLAMDILSGFQLTTLPDGEIGVCKPILIGCELDRIRLAIGAKLGCPLGTVVLREPVNVCGQDMPLVFRLQEVTTDGIVE